MFGNCRAFFVHDREVAVSFFREIKLSSYLSLRNRV